MQRRLNTRSIYHEIEFYYRILYRPMEATVRHYRHYDQHDRLRRVSPSTGEEKNVGLVRQAGISLRIYWLDKRVRYGSRT